MSEKIRVLLSEEEVDARIQEVADMINKDYDGKDVHMICVLKGGVFFMCELAKRITRPVTLDFMSVSSYGDDSDTAHTASEPAHENRHCGYPPALPPDIPAAYVQFL